MADDTNIKAILIRGDFTDREFGEIVALIRRLDEQRPTAHFEVTAVDPSRPSLDIAEQILRDALPEQPGRQTEWSKFTREEM